MINRILMIMKLAILMSIALTFQSFASIKAQKITLAAKNTSLSQVMKEIQKQQGISFFFRGKEIASTKVTVNIYQEELATAMDKILNGTDFAWYKEEGTIVINNKIMHIPFVPEVQQDWEVRGRGLMTRGTQLQVLISLYREVHIAAVPMNKVIFRYA